MSAAEVKFYTLDNKREICRAGNEQCFSFKCPKGRTRCGWLIIAGRTSIPRDGNNLNGGQAQWDWAQGTSRDEPSFSPSVNCKGCWHGYIRGGRCVDVQGIDEPEPKS